MNEKDWILNEAQYKSHPKYLWCIFCLFFTISLSFATIAGRLWTLIRSHFDKTLDYECFPQLYQEFYEVLIPVYSLSTTPFLVARLNTAVNFSLEILNLLISLNFSEFNTKPSEMGYHISTPTMKRKYLLFILDLTSPSQDMSTNLWLINLVHFTQS